MLTLCLAVVAVGYISAQPPPQECCTPAQFEGYADGITAYVKGEVVPTVLWAQQRFHIDHTYRRTSIYMELYVENEKRWRHIKSVTNYDTKKRYRVEDGACSIMDTTEEMMSQCLHVDSAHHDTFHIGGLNGLEIDSWRLPTEGPEGMSSRHIRTIRAPPEHCHTYNYVAMVVASSATETSFSDMASYNRITDGIEDTTVFDIPTECHHADKSPLPDVVDYMLKAYEK